MEQLDNCAVCLKFFTIVQQHTCKGCGAKIYSSILCPRCPKVTDHEDDNWFSDRCLRNSRPLMPMFTPMDSMLLWQSFTTIDFVYNLIIFFWISLSTAPVCVRCSTSPIFTSLHQKNLKLHEGSLHENNNEIIYFTKTSLHLV